MQQENNNQNQNWMPLESNPEVINTFIQKMGLRTEDFCFQQMMSTQEWALQMIPKPCLGIIFLYEETPVQKDHKNQQSPTLKPQEIPQDVFFMKQYAQNACGTIALFHITINASYQRPNIIVQNSYLEKFKNETSNKPPAQKGQFFKQNKEILSQHKSASSEGQSQAVESCESHFIAFIPKNGHIYELDGFKKCPVDHGLCSQQNFLQKGSELIQQFMQRDPDNINFSMLVLAKTQQQ